jgi:hypothetical protein
LLRAADVEDFRGGLRGQLLLPDVAGYDDARKIFNGMFDRRPDDRPLPGRRGRGARGPLRGRA